MRTVINTTRVPAAAPVLQELAAIDRQCAVWECEEMAGNAYLESRFIEAYDRRSELVEQLAGCSASTRDEAVGLVAVAEALANTGNEVDDPAALQRHIGALLSVAMGVFAPFKNHLH